MAPESSSRAKKLLIILATTAAAAANKKNQHNKSLTIVHLFACVSFASSLDDRSSNRFACLLLGAQLLQQVAHNGLAPFSFCIIESAAAVVVVVVFVSSRVERKVH